MSELRHVVAKLQAPAVAFDGPGEIPLGLPALDRALGGGLARGALHEIAACGEAHAAAATGFALGVAALPSLRRRGEDGESRGAKSVVWVAEDMALIESGAPYGPGLDLHGIAPERLLTVAGAKAGDVLWAMEEALHCRAVGLVIGEMRSTSRALDLVATRRLSLAAAAHGAMTLLLRTAPGTEASAAATRWVVGAAPSVHGIGPPRFALALTRNRRGPLGSWMLEWSVSDVCFALATHPESVAGTAADRPDRAHAA